MIPSLSEMMFDVKVQLCAGDLREDRGEDPLSERETRGAGAVPAVRGEILSACRSVAGAAELRPVQHGGPHHLCPLQHQADWSTSMSRSGPRNCWRQLSYAIKNQLVASKASKVLERKIPLGGYFACCSLVLYGIRAPIIGPFCAWKPPIIRELAPMRAKPRHSSTNESGPGCHQASLPPAPGDGREGDGPTQCGV